MRSLLQKVLDTRDESLIDSLMVKSGLKLVVDGEIISYMGKGMAKTGSGGIVDVDLYAVRGFLLSDPKNQPQPVLSTVDRPNGILIGSPKAPDPKVESPKVESPKI